MKNLNWAKAVKWVGNLGKGGRSAVFAASFRQLQEAEQKLSQDSIVLEAQFLDTSGELETLTQRGTAFISQVDKLVNLATGKSCDKTVFTNPIELIEQSTRFFVHCQEETTQMLGLLRDYNSRIQQMLGIEDELKRTMLPLKCMQTLFKVESAPLGVGVQQMFSSLTEEIEGLHSRVQEIFGAKFKQLEKTHQTIGLVIWQLDEQNRSLIQTTASQKVKIESSLAILKKEMDSNQDRDVRLRQLSRDLAREVQQIVMGLQFQDIVDQKLEHVKTALVQIHSTHAGFDAAPNKIEARNGMRFLEQSCQLEARQLQAAGEDLSNAEIAISASIQKVLSFLNEMDSRCLSLEEFKLLTSSFDGIVHVLLELIGDVRSLIAATVESAKKAFEMLEPLGGLASDLTAVVRDISTRIHLIALNSQVQAAQAAQDKRGVALEVLSTRTSEISDETNRISERVAAQLDTLASGLGESVRAFGQLRNDGLRQQALLDQRGRSEEAQLHAFRDTALDTLREIGHSLDKIRAQAHRTLESVQFKDFYEQTIPAMRAPLITISEAAGQWLASRAAGAPDTVLVEDFKRDYTMASERKVFADALKIHNPAVPPPGAPHAAAGERNPVPPDRIPSVEAGLIETVESHPAPLGEEVGPMAAAGSDLGANAELF